MNQMPSRLLRPAFVLLLLIAAALPLKFGALTGVPETTSMFPANLWEAVIINWPPMSFPMFSGGLLLLVALLPRKQPPIDRTGNYAMLWVLLFGVSFLGMANASTADFVYLQLVHIAGLAALAIAAAWLLRQDQAFRPQLLAAIAAVSVLLAFMGIQQYFFGFQETVEMMKQQQQYGNTVGNPQVIEAFLNDRRIFSTFTLPNSLAGYMLLTMPLCLLGCWNICAKIDPPTISRLVFMPLLIALLGFVFAMTRSRAAFISLGGAVAVFLVMLPLANRYRAALIGGILLTVAAGFLYIHHSSRGFSSIVARIDYNLTGLKIFALHPFLGTGWGDFFHDYMLLKALPTDEAPHTPHSFIMTYACQTGIAGLLAAGAVMLYPLAVGLRRIKSVRIKELLTIDNAILFGLTAWSLHSLLDVNLESPGCTGTAILLASCLLVPRGEPSEAPKWTLRKGFRLAICLLPLLLAAFAVAGSAVIIRGESRFAELTRMQSEICNPHATQKPTPEDIRSQFAATTAAMPWSAFPWASMGRFLAAMGDLNGAEGCYAEALKRSPARAAFYHELSMIQQKAGQFDEAAKSLEKARRMFPNNPRYRKPQQ